MVGDINPKAQGNYNPYSTNRQLIQRINVTTSGSNVFFPQIPQNFRHLEFYIMARGGNGGFTLDNCMCQFNGDTGGNYYSHWLYGQNASVVTGGSVGGTAGYLSRITDAGAQAGFFGVSHSTLYNYSKVDTLNTTYKFWESTSGTPSNVAGNSENFMFSGFWGNSLQPINQILLYPQSGSGWVQGSTFDLIGIL